MTTMTAFSDAEACLETAKDRGQQTSDDWKPVISECLNLAQMTGESLKMFERAPLEQPYLAFLDENDYENVVLFTEVPPVMIDAFLLKWQSELKKQGMKDVVIVTDPKRHKLLDLVGRTKERLTGSENKEDVLKAATEAAKSEPEPETKFVPEPEPAPVPVPEPARPAMVKNDSLVLHNGQTVNGRILEKRADGVWFRADEGVDMLFTHAEIKKVIDDGSEA